MTMTKSNQLTLLAAASGQGTSMSAETYAALAGCGGPTLDEARADAARAGHRIRRNPEATAATHSRTYVCARCGEATIATDRQRGPERVYRVSDLCHLPCVRRRNGRPVGGAR
jgi:hypothetical protein